MKAPYQGCQKTKEPNMKKTLYTLKMLLSIFIFTHCGSPSTPGGRGTIIPPTNVDVSKGTYENKIKISWKKVDNATSYTLYRSTKKTAPLSKWNFFDTANTEYIDNIIEKDQTYFYKIIAINDSEESSFSSVDFGYVKNNSELPVNIKASDGDYTQKVEIYWHGINSADGYNIYRCNSAVGIFEKINQKMLAQSYFEDNTALPSTNYYYYIKAVTGKTESFKSYLDRGFVAEAEKELILNSYQEGKVAIGQEQWFYFNAQKEVQYEVSWKEFGAEGYQANISISVYNEHKDSTYLIDKNYSPSPNFKALNNEKIYIKVKGTLLDHYGNFAIKINKITTAPTNLIASDGADMNKIILTWDNQPLNKGYHIYRSNSPTDTFEKINNEIVTKNSYEDTSITPGITYYYKITSVNQDNIESPKSYYNPGYARLPYLEISINHSTVNAQANIFCLIYNSKGKLVAVSANGTQLNNYEISFNPMAAKVENGNVFISKKLATFTEDTYTIYTFINDNDNIEIEIGELGNISNVNITNNDVGLMLSHNNFTPTVGQPVQVNANIQNEDGLSCKFYPPGSLANNMLNYFIAYSKTDNTSFLNNIATTDKHSPIIPGNYDVVCQNTGDGSWIKQGNYNLDGILLEL